MYQDSVSEEGTGDLRTPGTKSPFCVRAGYSYEVHGCNRAGNRVGNRWGDGKTLEEVSGIIESVLKERHLNNEDETVGAIFSIRIRERDERGTATGNDWWATYPRDETTLPLSEFK